MTSKELGVGSSFNLWRLLLMTALYNHTKTPISFLCRRELNLKFLIQLLETLPIELTGTHYGFGILANNDVLNFVSNQIWEVIYEYN